MMMRMLYLVRGVPGSGKSTLAHRLSPHVFEADMFFLKEGVYQYDREKLCEAHAWCQSMVKDAMIFEVPTIAVSNTFVQRWEMQDYYDLAKLHNYDVTEITMSGPLHENRHNVPPEKVRYMQRIWEK